MKYNSLKGFKVRSEYLSVQSPEVWPLPSYPNPLAFAHAEWDDLRWLSPFEDRGAFLLDFCRNPRDSIIMGGKETGKSLTLSILAIWLMLYTNLKTIGIIAGSEDQAKVTYAHLRRLLRSGKSTASWLESEPREAKCNIIGGGRVWVYSASYYSAHGEHPHVVIGDEAVLASRAQRGEILMGALASVTTGGVRILASAPYFHDRIVMPIWEKATEQGYTRYGPWRKHPFRELTEPFVTKVKVRPWLDLETQVAEARRAYHDPNSHYRSFWLGELQVGTGDVFAPEQVEACIQTYDIKPILKAEKALGVDTGFGSSLFGVVGVERRDDKKHVILAEQYERPNFNKMAYGIADVYSEDGYDVVYVDASNPAFIEQLEVLGVEVEKVVFGREVRDMISYARQDVENGELLIDPGFPELIDQMKNARWDASGSKMDKTGASLDEVDALLCALRYWAERPVGPVVAV